MADPRPCRVAGGLVQTGDPLPVLNPATGAEIARVCQAGEAEADRAVQAAADVFPALRDASRQQRSRWLQDIRQGLEERREEFARLIVEEAGKPITYARGEVARALSTFQFAAEEALRFAGEHVPLDVTSVAEGYSGFTTRVALGPVAAISPFNFPLNLVAHKVAPALAVGNPVVHKPAPDTPLTALLLGEVVDAAGVPPGALSVVPMSNDLAQRYLVEDPRIRLLSFTGSDVVGWSLKEKSGDKRVILELGGNAPVLVHSDADLAQAVPKLASAGYAYAGQVCISVQRVYVHEDVYEDFRDRYVEAVKALPVGDPRDEKTVVGPLIRPKDVERVDEWVHRAREAGARVLCGGEARGPYYLPTVLDEVKPDMWVSCREVFGPVTVLYRYSDFGEAVKAANDSPFGLQASVFTRDLGLVMKAWRGLEYGGIIVNDSPAFRVDNMPYGGVKRSGLGREGLRYAMEEMSEIRLLVVNEKAL